MDQSYTGGSWTMIPNVPSHSNSPAHSNQDQYYLHQQSQQQQQQFNQFQQQQQQQQQFQQQHQFQQQQQQQQRLIQQQQQQQNQQHQSLASHFHLLHLVENLAEVIENGTRDQHSDALITELNNHFEKCQQLLNSISTSINSKSMTVEGQKRKVEECEQLLNQRRDLLGKYRSSVEELIKSEL
ncbi:mediator of RNA polymerase II transcription subunit 9 isoform X3 [Manihot esculenta]|uniref:Mediator of RNA polymerase II transcription subunit 9 n=1 Tax=Manihot esculenta TaxID=3983 RepID=A0A2C9UXU9_MANES|nr:mediator of RNA polymerase II transcription subunit 9 isoform X3 [Manihot esculenta]